MKKTTAAYAFPLKKLSVAIACTTALSALASAPVFAQTAGNHIEEIIVTAAKRDQSLVDFSGSVSVVETGAPHLTLNDIAREVPGFFVVDAGPRNPSGLVMRGLRMDGVGANDLGGDGYAVASYVDNIPLQGYFAPPAFSLKDLQQVEVIRGPQGTLYGNASIGGLIRYTTAKPDLTKSSVSITGALSQTDKSDGLNYDTDLVVNVPLIENTLGVRLLLGKQHNEGFIDNPYLLSGAKKDINDDELSVARLSVLWQPTDEFSLSASQHIQQADVEDRQAANRDFTGDDYTASNRYLQPMDGDLRLSSVDASYKFPGATLTASVNRYDYEVQTLADQTDYLITIDELYYGFGFYSFYEDFSAYTAANVSVIKDSAELRLVSNDDQRLRWLVGAFYSTDELVVANADVTPGFSDALGLTRTNDIDLIAAQAEELREFSFYAEMAYDITPAWEVVLGVRSFRYDDDLAVCYIFATYDFGDEFYPADCYGDSDKHNDLLGKFSTKYKISDTQSVYFTVAEGFRRGGANALPADYADYRSYDPDTVVNYELGAHAYFYDEQVRVSGALFYIDWEDIQILTAFGQDYGIANAKSARSQGLELETHINLREGWALRAGFAFTDAELTENVESIIGGAENAYSGDRLPGTPRYQYNLGVDYKHTFDRATLDAGLSLSRSSEVYTELNDEFMDYDRLNGYTTASAQASVSWRNWRVGGFVHNIANTRGVTGKRTDNLFREQGQFEYITRPRTVGMSVSYTY